MKKKIIAFFVVAFLLIACVSCEKKSQNGENSSNDSSKIQQLQILRSDLKLTQDQVMSQIKADTIKENGGYLDDDEIVVIMKLEDDSLMDSYLDKYANKSNSIADFAATNIGKSKTLRILQKQDALINELVAKKLIKSVEYQYTTVMNAIAVKIVYKNFAALSEIANVEATYISDTYNLPQSVKAETGAVENIVDVYPTGIFNSSSVNYTGEGTAVAILDSGFDCSHTVFSTQPSVQLLTDKDISSVLSRTNAAALSGGDLELTDVYYSRKIPFVFDYADKDSDVFPYDSEHGTHVAGIIGGSDDVVTGVAVNTQLLLLKVFPDLDDGAETDDILAALEDAVLLGVDVINMSLGSSCGFSREYDNDAINEVYDMINESGISLITAASNSYSSSFGGEQGNTNMVTNPDSGTVGSPSTYPAALSVASISGIKSKYMIGNDSQIFFFKESNNINGDENDFFKEIGLKEGETKTYEYVTVPGVGLQVNYATLGDLTGKIVLVRRGDNTFEEKAQIAKNAGALACIIYNNVEGDILMSMGKSDHIPTISISKDDGVKLAAKDRGTLTLSYDYQAGPFISDFSSWGPTGSLELKPEITAHGGNILSSVPGGGYDQISGTSMATPNLSGIVVLIRQYLKELYPNYSAKEIAVLTNQLLMSTATIANNEVGLPYSPRKQGAGLASLYNSVNTKAYITVDGSDRTKLELFDDPKRTGVYTMEFNVVNLSNSAISYNLELIGMTETVSSSDDKHVAEMPQILNGQTTYELMNDGGSLNGNTLVLNANQTAKIKAVYRLSDVDKEIIETSFPYGMYVEGFVKLVAIDENEISLNVPFLAFYGDWTEAPMFDKTYYEVDAEANNPSINEEDKLKADYFATTPYGSYYYNYIIPLGTYLYDIDTTLYDVIPASKDKIAISNILGTIDGISTIYGGLLRNAKEMRYTIVDKLTGEVVYSYTDYNANKAYSLGGGPIPYYDFLDISSYQLGLVNNREYEFKMQALLDYGDGGENTNVRNTFEFDFFADDEAPVLKDATYEKIYDENLKKDRYYITLTVYDNHYAQSITPIIFTSNESYSFLTENPIPIYGEKGKDTKVRFEITDFLADIGEDALITSALAFSIDDYALNSNIYLCQLPGTKGDFKFTKNGELDGSDLVILSMYEDEVVDLTQYLATADSTVDANKDYLKYLVWSSSNEKVATVQDGEVRGIAPGRTTITVQEQMDLKQAVLIINVKERSTNMLTDAKQNLAETRDIENVNDEKIKEIRFSYFETLFAYSRAAQTSEIGSTGSKIFISSLPSINFFPGEKIKLYYDLDPWYVADQYEVSYSSTNPSVASVDQNGVVTGLKKGNTTIVLTVAGSNIMARIRVTVKSEFVIEDRILVAYKGLGGDVVIPDDEGIYAIGAYAFCLYETDMSVDLPEDDYDANKIPSANTTIKSVTIPSGVEEIQKYAFYNCSGLERVVLPDTIKFIREYAFYKDVKLQNINLNNVLSIGAYAFYQCELLNNIALDRAYAIGKNAFDGCISLESIDLSALRNSGQETFKNCTALRNVVFALNTKLSYAMFFGSGIENVTLYETVEIPDFCFAKCENLTIVTLESSLIKIGKCAFSECPKLTDVNLKGTVDAIDEQAFYSCPSLVVFTLPNSEVTLGAYVFYQCENLEEVKFNVLTKVNNLSGSAFEGTKVERFTIDGNNTNYNFDGTYLLNKEEDAIIFVLPTLSEKVLTIPVNILTIGVGSFSGLPVEEITITNPDTVIEGYAFANCKSLVKVTLPLQNNIIIKEHAFNYTEKLTEITNLDQVKNIGDYAFANSNIRNVTLASNATFGEGAFFQSKIVEVTIGANSTFGLGVFQNCTVLTTVNMPQEGGVHFGIACFANDIELSTIDLSKVDSIIENETFYGCAKLAKANLLQVEKIGDYAFSDCASLTYLSMPKIVEIGEGAFSRYDENGGAPQFMEVLLPSTLKIVKDGAFLGCEGLTTMILPSSIEKIGDFIFAYCINLIEVELPENMKYVGQYSFAGCTALTSINLGNVEEIADYAFTSAESLERVDLTNVKKIGYGSFASTMVSGNHQLNQLESVGDYAFQGTYLITFEAPNLKKIGVAAFENNPLLTSFIFSDSLEEMGMKAFDGCISLTNYYYLDENGQKQITAELNDYAYLNNNVLYTKLPNGQYQLSSVPTALDIDVLVVDEGTYRVDDYAGSQNANIEKIILPDTLKLIGDYAFYKYTNLKEVEFKSFSAPILEDYYDPNAVLLETDPGYELLHAHFDLFGYELYYFNFVDLVGKNEPIMMTLPANADIEGYDSIVYEAYFGKVTDAKRSTYEAMSKYMIEFIENANLIKNIEIVNLSHEELINDAITAYNAIKQDPIQFGFTQNEWDLLVAKVFEAREVLMAKKLAVAPLEVQNLQVEINNLPTTFNISLLETLKTLSTRINNLKADDRLVLNLTNYNNLISSYNEYLANVEDEITPTIDAIDNTIVYVVVSSITGVSLLAMAFVMKRFLLK